LAFLEIGLVSRLVSKKICLYPPKMFCSSFNP
jgi:hypothetical protein